MIKSFFNWKVLLNIVLAVGIFVGLIYLTFRWLEKHTHHGEEIPVPNIVNMPMQEAIKVLEEAGLDYEIDSGEFQPKYKPLQVLQIYPSAGSNVKAHRIIQIRINPRTWAKVTIPDILDKYKGLAFRQLEQVGLKVGDTIYEPNIQRDAVIRMQMNGRIIKPGEQVSRFTMIDLVIGTGPKRNVAVPNLIGMTVADAEKIIAQNLFEVGVVEYEDGRGDKSDIIYYQDPQGGSLRDQGMQIDLWASKKTPSQLVDKIHALDMVYGKKIDEPVFGADADDFFSEPIEKQPIISTKPKVEKKEPEQKSIPKKEEKTSEKKVEKDKKAEKPTEKKIEKKPSETPKKSEEKPKVRQIIVE